MGEGGKTFRCSLLPQISKMQCYILVLSMCVCMGVRFYELRFIQNAIRYMIRTRFERNSVKRLINSGKSSVGFRVNQCNRGVTGARENWVLLKRTIHVINFANLINLWNPIRNGPLEIFPANQF